MRIEKEYIAKEMEARYQGSTLMVVAAYHGLKAKDMTKLRARVAESNGVLNVVKNRIAKRVVNETAGTEFIELMKGPNAIAATRGDAVALAKALTQFAKENEALVLRGGLLDLSRFLTAEELAGLAALPSREVLLARLLAGLQGPARGLACLFSTMLGNLVRVLDKVGQTKPAVSAAAAAAAEPVAEAAAPAEPVAETAAPGEPVAEAAAAAEPVAEAAGEPAADTAAPATAETQ